MTRKERHLRKVIHTVLDCGSHFHKPTIVENDPDYKFGPDAIVVCSQCVMKLRRAIGLKKGDPIPAPMWFDEDNK